MKRMIYRRGLLVLLFLILMLGFAFIYVNRSLRPVLEGLSKARVESIAAAAMNDAVLQILSKDANTDDLVVAHESNGSVYFLEANSSKLVSLYREIISNIKKALEELNKERD